MRNLRETYNITISGSKNKKESIHKDRLQIFVSKLLYISYKHLMYEQDS